MDVTINGARRRVGYGSPTTEFNPSTAASYSTPRSPAPPPDDTELTYFRPREWGERSINLTHYWHSRVAKAAASFAVVLCVLLVVYRLLATTVVGGNVVWALPYFLAIGIAAVSHSTIYLRDYVRTPTRVDTRFAAAQELFTLQGFMELAKFSVGGALIAWAFAAQLGTYYQGPILFTTDLTNRNTKFLNEELFYIILAGAYTGAFLFCQRHFDISRPYMKLPIVHRHSFLEFKAKARPTLKKSFRKSLWISASFTVAYHTILHDLKNTIVHHSLILDSSTLEIDHTWYEFLNIRRFLVLYMSCGFAVFSYHIAKVFMRMSMLAPREFGVELYHPDQPDLSLSEAMADTRVPLVRLLAFQYLLAVSAGRDLESKSRRKKIFMLSPPSDVAEEWQAVKCDCLAVIEKMTVALGSFRVVEVQTEGGFSGLPQHLAVKWKQLENQRLQTVQQLRAMTLLEQIRYKLRRFIDRIPWLMYIFDNEQENGFMRHVRNCQEMLIACQALSHLVAASIREDSYGVVQGDIRQILAAFTALKDRLAVFSKASPLCKGYAIAVHRCLVRIWLTFPDTLGAEALKHFL